MMRWRLGFLGIFLFCAGAIAFALYHQYYNWLMPCLMCVYERIVIIVVGILALLAALIAPQSRIGVIVACNLVVMSALVGAGVGVRHLFMQYGPPDPAVSCAANLPFSIDLNDPFWPTWFSGLIRPVGDCSVVDFTLFGLSMPVWLVLSCVVMATAALMLGVWRWRELPVMGLQKTDDQK